MAVSEESRARLSRWCADRIPDDEREQRLIGYSIHGDEVTIVDRRAPRYPELDAGWTSTPLALLRVDPASGRWSLHRPDADSGWAHERDGDDPIALLESVT